MPPAMIPAIALGVSIAGSVIGGGMSIISGLNQSAAAKAAAKYQAGVNQYNQTMAEYNAQMVEEATRNRVDQQRRKGLALLGSQVAGYGKAGVDLTGTPLVVMGDTAEQIQMDLSNIERSGQLEAWKLRNKVSAPVIDNSSQYATAGILGGGSSILTGVGSSLLTYAGGVPKFGGK